MTDPNRSGRGFLSISDLDFGYNDAVTYKNKHYKDMFTKIFIRTSNLEEIKKPTAYFIIGEKGYGKTALSVFMSNNSIDNTFSTTISLGSTDYTDFITLKKQKLWILSDYKNAWKVTLLYLIAQLIMSRATLTKTIFNSEYSNLKKLLAEYEQYSRYPEISQALKMIQSYSSGGEAGLSHSIAVAKVSANRETVRESNESKIQDRLRDLQKKFEDSIRGLKIGENFTIFIDGIDVRPIEIEHSEYSECIRGLGNAAWELNSEYFSNLKDTKGNLKIVLLLRHDILRQMQLHNISSKIDDNSVIINWFTPKSQIMTSSLFSFAKKLLSWNQTYQTDDLTIWRHYFREDDISKTFGEILKYTFYRPRDIVKMLGLIKKYSCESRDQFLNIRQLQNPALLRAYSEYMLSEIKDQIAFLYDEEDYKILLRFFDYFQGKTRLKHREFSDAYNKLILYLEKHDQSIPIFCRKEEEFLQFLYDLGIICYIESSETGTRFYRWSFIEKSHTNLNPQVKLGTDYEIHRGLVKSLNLGTIIKDSTPAKSNERDRTVLKIRESVSGRVKLKNKRR